MSETYKFQKLYVYQLALDYIDTIYGIISDLPNQERYNLVSQIRRAAVSVALNIAEGSTSQSDAEQRRFLGLALRSYIETIACIDIMERQDYFPSEVLKSIRNQGHQLFIKIVAFRKKLV